MNGNYKSLTEFAQELDRREQVKEDYIVPNTVLQMENPNSITIGGSKIYNLNTVAHAQLADKLNIPKKYYDRLKEVPGLREQNVNAWLTGDSRHLIRTLDGEARAILSDAYKPMDNSLIMQGALPVLQSIPDLKVRTQALTDTKMYLQFTIPGLRAEVTPGDVVEYGVTLTNSEVGHGAVNVQTFLYRLVCSNGMVRNSLLNQRHVGRKLGGSTEDYSLFKHDTIVAELESFKLRFRDTLGAALTDIEFHKHVDALRTAAGDMIERPDTVIKNVTQRFNLTQEEGESILVNMVQNNGLSRWGLANGITAQCHIAGVPVDRQYQFESIGSDIIDLTPNEWQALTA